MILPSRRTCPNCNLATMGRLFLHYYEGDASKHLSLLVDVPESHLAKHASTIRPLFASLYEAETGSRPEKAGLLRVYDEAGEASTTLGALPDGAHIFLARPPAVARPAPVAPPPPPPPPAAAAPATGVSRNNEPVVYYDSSDEEDDAQPWKRWENRRFGDKRIINGALLRDDGSREVGRWLSDSRFVATIPPGRMNNAVDGTWLAVFTPEGAGTLFQRGTGHAEVAILDWRPTLFEYFVADGEAPRQPAYIQDAPAPSG